MISPTVGRVVWYFESPQDFKAKAEPQVALITHVEDDNHVNIVKWDAKGEPKGLQGVTLWHGEGDQAEGYFVTWMPYQQAQAARHEALQAGDKKPLARGESTPLFREDVGASMTGKVPEPKPEPDEPDDEPPTAEKKNESRKPKKSGGKDSESHG